MDNFLQSHMNHIFMCTWMEPEDEKDAKYNCDTQNGVLGFVTLANTKEA